MTFFSFEAMTVMTVLGDSVIQNTDAKAALTLHTGTLRYSFYMLSFYFLVILVFIFFIILGFIILKDCPQNENLKQKKLSVNL